MNLDDEKFTRFNWFNYSEFYDFITEKNFKVLVELGVWKGHSISYLAKRNSESEIYAIDLWDMFPFEYNDKITTGPWLGPKPKEKFLDDGKNIKKIYEEYLVLNNTRHLINDIQLDAKKAADLFDNDEVDFIFIDLWPESDYLSVLNSWDCKIKKNGIISGHDYDVGKIKNSVNQFASKNEYRINTEEKQKVWWLTK